MPKQSFRDLLNFKAIKPIENYDMPPTSDSDKIIGSKEDNRVKADINEKNIRVAPNDFFRQRISHVGKVVGAHYSQSELDAMNNWWGIKDTALYKKIFPKTDNSATVGTIINSVLGNSKNAFRFLKEITDDPWGNKWHKAVQNDREETLIAAVRKHINAFKTNYQQIKNLIRKPIDGKPYNNIWDPYTSKNYLNNNISVKDRDAILELESISMPMDTSEVKDLGKYTKDVIDKMGDGDLPIEKRGRGTLIFNKEKIKSAIFNTSDEILGWHIREFAIESKLNDSMYRYNTDYDDYYTNFTSPYSKPTDIKSPKDALDFANSLGFCKGYKDLAGFSLDSSHIWSITIEPYIFPGFYVALTPPLPKYRVPTWNIDQSTNKFVCNYTTLDYGKVAPIVSYNLTIGTSMEKDITLTNGASMKVPVGFSYNYGLTLTFADDQHSSIKNYMMYYYNTIFNPTEGLMAPYELCSFLINITSFKPGLKVKSQLKLICIPVGYTVTQSGESSASTELVQVGFSVVGMKTSYNYDSTVDRTLGGIWSSLNWNDIIMRPVPNRKMTKPPRANNSIGDWDDSSLLKVSDNELINDEIDEELINVSDEELINDEINEEEFIDVNDDELINDEVLEEYPEFIMDYNKPIHIEEDDKFKALVSKDKINKDESYSNKSINKFDEIYNS